MNLNEVIANKANKILGKKSRLSMILFTPMIIVT